MISRCRGCSLLRWISNIVDSQGQKEEDGKSLSLQSKHSHRCERSGRCARISSIMSREWKIYSRNKFRLDQDSDGI